MDREFPKFLRKLMLLLPLLIAVIGVNALRDPLHVFGRREQEDAMRMARGESLIFDEAENDRLLVRNYVGMVQEPRDVIVIGSSRTTYFHAGLFPGKEFFNASVLGRTLPDTLALYELFREREWLPKILILEVDPYLIEERSTYYGVQTRWLSLYPEYARALVRLGQDPAPWDYWLSLANVVPAEIEELSPATFQKSLLLALGRLTRAKTLVPNVWNMEHPPPDFVLRLPDGALVYSLADTTLTRAELERRVLKNIQSGPSSGSSQHISPTAQRRFEGFVRGIQRDGVKLYFFLSPYNPLYRNRLRGTPTDTFLEDAEAYYRTFARAARIQLIGSYDPDRTGCDADEFVDGLHPTLPCITRIWQDARAREIVP